MERKFTLTTKKTMRVGKQVYTDLVKKMLSVHIAHMDRKMKACIQCPPRCKPARGELKRNPYTRPYKDKENIPRELLPLYLQQLLRKANENNAKPQELKDLRKQAERVEQLYRDAQGDIDTIRDTQAHHNRQVLAKVNALGSAIAEDLGEETYSGDVRAGLEADDFGTASPVDGRGTLLRRRMRPFVRPAPSPRLPAFLSTISPAPRSPPVATPVIVGSQSPAPAPIHVDLAPDVQASLVPYDASPAKTPDSLTGNEETPILQDSTSPSAPDETPEVSRRIVFGPEVIENADAQNEEKTAEVPQTDEDVADIVVTDADITDVVDPAKPLRTRIPPRKSEKEASLSPAPAPGQYDDTPPTSPKEADSEWSGITTEMTDEMIGDDWWLNGLPSRHFVVLSKTMHAADTDGQTLFDYVRDRNPYNIIAQNVTKEESEAEFERFRGDTNERQWKVPGRLAAKNEWKWGLNPKIILLRPSTIFCPIRPNAEISEDEEGISHIPLGVEQHWVVEVEADGDRKIIVIPESEIEPFTAAEESDDEVREAIITDKDGTPTPYSTPQATPQATPHGTPPKKRRQHDSEEEWTPGDASDASEATPATIVRSTRKSRARMLAQLKTREDWKRPVFSPYKVRVRTKPTRRKKKPAVRSEDVVLSDSDEDNPAPPPSPVALANPPNTKVYLTERLENAGYPGNTEGLFVGKDKELRFYLKYKSKNMRRAEYFTNAIQSFWDAIETKEINRSETRKLFENLHAHFEEIDGDIDRDKLNKLSSELAKRMKTLKGDALERFMNAPITEIKKEDHKDPEFWGSYSDDTYPLQEILQAHSTAEGIGDAVWKKIADDLSEDAYAAFQKTISDMRDKGAAPRPPKRSKAPASKSAEAARILKAAAKVHKPRAPLTPATMPSLAAVTASEKPKPKRKKRKSKSRERK